MLLVLRWLSLFLPYLLFHCKSHSVPYSAYSTAYLILLLYLLLHILIVFDFLPCMTTFPPACLSSLLFHGVFHFVSYYPTIWYCYSLTISVFLLYYLLHCLCYWLTSCLNPAATCFTFYTNSCSITEPVCFPGSLILQLHVSHFGPIPTLQLLPFFLLLSLLLLHFLQLLQLLHTIYWSYFSCYFA